MEYRMPYEIKMLLANRHRWMRPTVAPARQTGTWIFSSWRDGRLSSPLWLVICSPYTC